MKQSAIWLPVAWDWQCFPDTHCLMNPASEGLCILDVQGFPLRKPWLVIHLKSKILSLPARAFLDELLQANHCCLERQASQ
jgi:hypothetical protein